MNELFASLPTPGLLTASFGRFLAHWRADIDETVPGTTDGVLFMGVLIVSIIIIPIISTRRHWMR